MRFKAGSLDAVGLLLHAGKPDWSLLDTLTPR